MSNESNLIKPKTAERYENSIVLSWKHEIIIDSEQFQLQILNDFKEWITLYKGNRTQYTVRNLAPSQVYTFRIKLESTDWLVFRSGTHTGPFYTNRHLMSAIRSQKFGLIRKIIKARHDLLEIENKKCNTPLVHAILDNDLKMVNLLLHLGSDINKPLTYSNKTPLMVAISHGFFELVKFLVNKGAYLNDKDINGLGILHIAVDSGNYEIVQYFVELGLDVNAMDRHGLTPLLRAGKVNVMLIVSYVKFLFYLPPRPY
ncbi:hypothetical protein WA026_012059 [Henosepilachna vigintioctopunctata]|uniref:Uncharacterized protein n=1 Tax=Henosepilachna vigintioctopunctata TaxID=420089 RepID=A0AAW1V7P4_9CUCU